MEAATFTRKEFQDRTQPFPFFLFRDGIRSGPGGTGSQVNDGGSLGNHGINPGQKGFHVQGTVFPKETASFEEGIIGQVDDPHNFGLSFTLVTHFEQK
jgi:hypothetical protein